MNTHISTNAVVSPSVSLYSGRPATTSLEVAKFFGKRHDAVLRDIRRIYAETPEEFRAHNFVGTFHTIPGPNNSGRQEVYYILYRDGFMLLVMGYTGRRALTMKLAYIEAFNRMEAALQNGQQDGLPDFTNPAEAARAWAEQYEEKREALGRLSLALPKAETYDAVVAPRELTLAAFCRRLENTNLNLVRTCLMQAGVLYQDKSGRPRVYARYRDTHFSEKFDSRHGSVTIMVLPKGQQLLTRYHADGVLARRATSSKPVDWHEQED